MTSKKYKITKEQCQIGINERDNVCNYCGRPIVPIETVDNSGDPTFWPGCLHGDELSGHFTSGICKPLYDLAKRLILDGEYGYRHLCKQEYAATPDLRLYWFYSQVSGMCSTLRQIEHLKTNDPRKTLDQFLTDERW